jgi:hypothetical protein
MADNGSIVVLLDEFSLLARETARNEVDILLEDASVSSSVNLPISVETDKTLEDVISLSTNYAEVEAILEDAEVDNPIIGSLEFLLEDADLSSALDVSGIRLVKTLNNATLNSTLEASGITLVKTLDKASLFSSVIATGGSLNVVLDYFDLESQAISDNQVNVSISLEDVSKTIEADLLVQSQLEKSLEDVSVSSSYSTNIVATLVKDLEELTVDSDVKGNVFFPAEIEFGDVVSSAEGYLLTGLLSPYQDFANWTGHPATGQSLKVRIGNLKGVTNLDEFGLFASSGWNLASQGTIDEENIPDSVSHLIASNKGVRAYNMDITLFDNGAPVIELNHSVPSFALGSTLPSGYNSGEGIWMGKDTDDTYKFRVGGTGDQDNSIRYDGDALEIRGAEFIQYNLSTPVISLNPAGPSLAIGNPVPASFSAGVGLWTGLDGGEFKFRIGDPTDARLEWLTDTGELNLYGTSLTFDGEEGFIILTQSSLFKDISGNFTGSGVYIDSQGISGVNLDQEQVRIDSQTGEIIASGVHLNASGISMVGGTFTVGQATSFSSGIGVFIGELPSDVLVSESLGDYIYSEGSELGYQGTDEFRIALGGGWAFRIGDPAGDRLEWDGSNLNLYAPVINLIEGISDPTLYFKSLAGDPLFTVTAYETTVPIVELNSIGTNAELHINADVIDFSSVPTVDSDPTEALQLATKQYVDNNTGGVEDHGLLTGLGDDDHTQYLNNARHDTTTRHTLGTVVPHDDHGLLSGLGDDDHTQYLNNTRHDTTTRHTLGTVVPRDSTKADDADVVHDTGDETVAGVKTFSSIPVLPASDPTLANQAVRKSYVDNGYRYLQTVTFTSNGTFSKANYSGIRAVRVRLVGGGGGGAGAPATAAGQVSCGSGGNAGGYSEEFILASVLASSVTVTIGSGGSGGSSGGDGGGGGTTSFGSFLSATGGGGGNALGASSSGVIPAITADAAGIGSGGDFNTRGGTSGVALRNGDSEVSLGSRGGDSLLGGGAGGRFTAWHGSGGGWSADGYGGGGGGACNGSSQGAKNGGNGKSGIVIVDVYI